LHPDKNSSPNAKDKFAEANKYTTHDQAHTKCCLMHKKGKTTIKLAQPSKILSKEQIKRIFLIIFAMEGPILVAAQM
jgi:hypothetical protein